MGKKPVVTQKDIDLIKALLTAGLKKTKIEEISNRSWGVITAIEKSDGTLKDYRDIQNKKYIKYNKSREKVETPEYKITDYVDVPAVHLEELRSIRAELKLQNQKLEHVETLLNELVDNLGAESALKKSAESNGRRTIVGLFK